MRFDIPLQDLRGPEATGAVEHTPDHVGGEKMFIDFAGKT